MNDVMLGNRIRQSRQLRKITQMQLANQLNFSQQHIGNIEKGRSHASLDLVVKISNCLDVSLDFLLQDSLNRPYAHKPSYLIQTLEDSLEIQQTHTGILLELLHTRQFEDSSNNA